MENKKKFIYPIVLYIHFLILALIIFFFSTTKIEAKGFDIDNIEISKPFEINFDKNQVIDEGFKKAFFELISIIVNSEDHQKIKKIGLNEIKGMIETFSIKEEKFIKEVYYVNLGVSFNKKKIFKYLEKKNIFPSIPKSKKFLFVPIIIDEKKRDLLIFSKNMIFNQWNQNIEKHHLIEYILPTEDLEDINIIKRKFENIEQYNFKEITDKYFLGNSIIALFFKNDDEVRVLSRITIKNDISLKNQSFKNFDMNDLNKTNEIIKELKIIYEDYWKKSNQINTSIKLLLSIKVNNIDNLIISNFEKTLDETDFIYDYSISKLNKDFTFYKIIFNGSTNNFLKSMEEKNYQFNTQNKTWILK
tara:strand:+ start:2485 stop:3564 length:1080 start_codon:yes stop_codon:yes gene_type:complete